MNEWHLANHIPSIMFSGAILWAFLYFVKKIKAQDTAIEKYSEVLNVYMESDNVKYTTIDMAFSKEVVPNEMPIELKAIASDLSKGYDFLHVKFKKDYGGVPEHYHRNSDELMYVLKGSLQVKTDYRHRNIFARLISNKCESEVSYIAKGKWHYIPRQCKHTLTITEDTELIVVARPPLFTRIGRLYEKFFKKQQ